MSIKSFRDLKPGAIFHALKPEKIGERIVRSEGLHVKIGNSHAVKVEAISNGSISATKDVIFPLNMPCREEKNSKIDTSHLVDWKIINANKPVPVQTECRTNAN